jgi:hypothetical protein
MFRQADERAYGGPFAPRTRLDASQAAVSPCRCSKPAREGGGEVRRDVDVPCKVGLPYHSER